MTFLQAVVTLVAGAQGVATAWEGGVRAKMPESVKVPTRFARAWKGDQWVITPGSLVYDSNGLLIGVEVNGSLVPHSNGQDRRIMVLFPVRNERRVGKERIGDVYGVTFDDKGKVVQDVLVAKGAELVE